VAEGWGEAHCNLLGAVDKKKEASNSLADSGRDYDESISGILSGA